MTSRALNPDSPPAAPGTDDAASPGRSSIDLGSIDDLRILAPDGSVDASLDPNFSDEVLLALYRAMVLTRVFDVRMLRMQRQGRMGTFAPGYGQEATQIGQVWPLEQRDWFSPSYRSFGAQIHRGWEMERLFLLWDGYFEGFAPPPGVNDLPFSIVIGSHVLPAVGVAMGMRHRGDDSVMVTNYGDGAASQGAVSEALNFAAVSKAPVVFVCENNGWAISTPSDQQSAVDVLARRGPAFGVPSIRVDGNDILAMVVATREAVAHARAGHGPYLIEAVTYRMGVHTTADDPKVYRDDAEVETWTERCPITRFQYYLRSRGLLDDIIIAQIEQACDEDVRAARTTFEENAKPNPKEIFDFMFESLSPELEAQRDEYLRRLERKGVLDSDGGPA